MKEKVDGRVAQHEDSPVEITIRRWSVGGIALAIVLTGFGGFLSWRSVRQSSEDSDWVAHTHAVNVALEATLTHAVDVETGARGFGATGDETFLGPFVSGRLAFHSNLDMLTHLTADNSSQQQRLQKLRPQIDARIAIAEETIAERRRTGTVPSAATFKQGKQRMDALRATIDEMRAEEVRLLDQRTKHSAAARRKTTSITLISTLSGILLLLFAGLVTSQQIGHSAKLRGQIQALNKDLEWRVEDRTKKLQAEVNERRRAEDATLASERRYRQLFECSNDGICFNEMVFDSEGQPCDFRWLDINPRYEVLTGLTRQQVIGRRALEVLPTLERHWLDLFSRVVATGDPASFEQFALPLGRRYQGNAYRTGEGKFAVSFTDVTERRRAEEALRLSNARTRFALENAKIGDWQLDLTTLQATRSLLHDQIFGYQSLLSEWNFDVFLRHIHSDDRERIRDDFHSCASQGKRWEFECRIIRAGGDMRWIWACGDAQKEASGDPSGMFGIVQDITERKLAEEQVRTLNNELEHRVRERTAQLEAANKELEAFTYSVSHDLRAPLRHISGFSKMLVEEFASALPPDAQHYLERIQGGTLRMGLLVDDLLNLGRVGRQALHLQVAGLRTIVDQLIDELQPECVDRLVEWRIGALPFLDCDPGLLKQVFQNLITNALKFTRPRAAAVIEVGQHEEDGAPVIFVRDNGVGFSMKYSDKLFGVFQRLHRQEDFEGTGVGLATVQRIVQKHGGRIWAEAELDKGATFYFTIGSAERDEAKKKAVAAGEKS